MLGAAGLLSACAGVGNDTPLDVGSMALPTSSQRAAGITTSASRPTTFDTGSMALPAPLPQGVISTTATQVRTPETGNMAFPDPRPQGNLVSGSR